MKFRRLGGRLGIQRTLVFLLIVLGGLQLWIILVPTQNTQQESYLEILDTEPEFLELISINATSVSRSKTEESKYVDDATVRVPLTLVIAYMRGGSTFTADILRRASGTYYLFEPIRDLLMRIEDRQPFLLMNGTEVRNFSNPEAVARFVAETIRNWFLCQPEKVDRGSLLDSHFRFEMPGLSSFYTCHKDLNGDRIMTMKKCLPILQQKCLNAKARTIKIVATKMDVVKNLLKILPTVKIVHIIRDPRAIINSQKRTGLIDRRKFVQQAEKICKDMHFNLDILREILLEFNNSIKVILYEEFVKFPLETARDIYEFTGLPFTKTVEKFVHNIALLDYVTSKCMWCSAKGNSLKASLEWRFRIKDTELKMIQNACGGVMKRLLYKTVPDVRTLVDTSLSLRENGTLNLLGE